MDKYSCLTPGNNVAVTVTSRMLKKAMTDEKTGKWLERELGKAPDYIKQAQQSEKPVLIDPITAKIYRIKNETNCSDGNYGRFRQFHRMPMLDYPLFLTDATIFTEGLENFKYSQSEDK